MPIVPKAERSVRPRAPVVRTPDVGGTVPGAFGEDVAAAQASLGAAGVKAGTTLLQHMARQKYYREEAIGENAGNKLDDFALRASYSQIDEDIEVPGPDGTTTTIQGGWLNTSAYGADKTLQKGTQALKDYYNNTLETLPSDVSKRTFTERYNSTLKTYSKTWMKHEADQMKVGAQNTVYETVAATLAKLPTLDEEGIKEATAYTDKLWDKGYAQGNFTFEQVAKGKDDFRYGVYLTDRKSDIPPVILEKKLKTNAYGMSVEKLKQATTLYNKEKTRIETENEEELDQMEFEGTLTLETIDRYVIEGRIKPGNGNDRKAALIAEEAKNPDPFAYTSTLERAASVKGIGYSWYWPSRSPKEKEERFREAATLRRDIFRMRREGKLTREQGIKIIAKMGNALEDFAPYKEGILQLKGFADRNYTPEEKDIVKKELYQNFMSKVQNKVDPVLAIAQAKDEFIKDKRPEVAQYVVGETYDTPYGAIKVLSIDEDGEPMVELVEVK